jgi:PKD repeat protein
MSCQLCYRAEDGSVVYGEPVLGGECTLKLDKKPANDVVLAVICNTDYIYEGEQTRKAHFDYKLKLGHGVKERANWNIKWYRWDSNLTNTAVPITTADFIGSANSIPAGSAVQFTDRSKNIVRGWLWDFGDGETSTEQNPSHTYSTTGTYTVSLTVLGTNGEVTETKSGYIIVGSTGILDIKKDNNIVLFPNPASERCTMIWPDGILSDPDLKIFNANGKELVLKSSINEKSCEIDLSEFSSGLYYISVITDNIPVTKKLIVLK